MFEWEEDEPSPSRARPVIIGATVIVLAALGWFVVRPALTDDDERGERRPVGRSTRLTPPRRTASR